LSSRGEYTEAFALVGGAVDVDLGADDGAKRHEHLRQFGVSELLRQVVDEQIAALRSCDMVRRDKQTGRRRLDRALTRPRLFIGLLRNFQRDCSPYVLRKTNDDAIVCPSQVINECDQQTESILLHF